MAPHKTTMEIERLAVDAGLRLRTIRLQALADAPDAFGSTYAEVAARPLASWPKQLQEIAGLAATEPRRALVAKGFSSLLGIFGGPHQVGETPLVVGIGVEFHEQRAVD